MKVKDFNCYQECENTYWGYTEHYDTLTTIILKNQAKPLENMTINIPNLRPRDLDFEEKKILVT